MTLRTANVVGALALWEDSARRLLGLERMNRWTGSLIGLTLGALDTAAFLVLGTQFTMDGTDVTLIVCGSFSGSLTILGFLLGLTMETRQRERRAAEELDAARHQIAQSEKLASLGQLASAIAHEVRNPLAIIRSTVQNVAETLPKGETADTDLVIEEIDRLTKVTSSLVAFARPLRVKKERVAAKEILERTERLAARMLGERQIHLKTDIALDATVDADRDLVCQVLLGLLGNAAEVTPAGGTISLDAENDGVFVSVAVSDSGPGVPEELVHKIFEPFFTTRKAGAGLGLAVAKQIVTAHDGEMAVQTAVGGGARFVVRLRRAA